TCSAHPCSTLTETADYPNHLPAAWPRNARRSMDAGIKNTAVAIQPIGIPVPGEDEATLLLPFHKVGIRGFTVLVVAVENGRVIDILFQVSGQVTDPGTELRQGKRADPNRARGHPQFG